MNHTQISHVVGSISQVADLLRDHQPTQSPIAVVNPANAYLQTGGGVTGALVQGVGGSQNWYQLVKQAQTPQGQWANKTLNIGEAVYTLTSGQLLTDHVKYLIHTLGPVAGIHEIELIRPTINNVLNLANYLQVKTLVLPAISGGLFSGGSSNWAKEVRQIIVQELQTYIRTQPTSLHAIYLVSYDDDDQKLWEA